MFRKPSIIFSFSVTFSIFLTTIFSTNTGNAATRTYSVDEIRLKVWTNTSLFECDDWDGLQKSWKQVGQELAIIPPRQLGYNHLWYKNNYGLAKAVVAPKALNIYSYQNNSVTNIFRAFGYPNRFWVTRDGVVTMDYHHIKVVDISRSLGVNTHITFGVSFDINPNGVCIGVSP